MLCGGPDWPTAVLCGILRADPNLLKSSAARTVLSKSFALNWLWWKGLTWIVTQTTDGGKRIPPWVERGPRLIPQETLSNFKASMRHIHNRLSKADIAHVSFLAAPAGWSMCPQKPRPTSECGWLAHDQQAMADLLSEEGLPWMDLRSLWGASEEYTQRMERQFYREFGRLPVYPNEKGHERIFQEIWPNVQKAWTEKNK